jgi:quercetin dioxygenase-like cupin family protein
MFYNKNSENYLNPVEGIYLKTLTHGEKISLVEFKLKKGEQLPAHDHPHEQAGYLVSGSMDLTIGDQVYRVSPGDSWCIPGGVEHSTILLADSVAIEVFAPVREDYIS